MSERARCKVKVIAAFLTAIAVAIGCALSLHGLAFASSVQDADNPPEQLRVQVFVDGYGGLVVYERDYGAAELVAMGSGRQPVKFCGYRGGQFPSGRIATEYIPFTELLEDAGVLFGPGDSLVMGSADGATKITYEECFATPRYYYPHFYDSKQSSFTDATGAVEVVPSILLKSYGIPHPEDKADGSAGLSLDAQLDLAAQNGLCDYKYAYMMGFGQRAIDDTAEDTYSAMGWSRQSEVVQITYPTLASALEKLSAMYAEGAQGTDGLNGLLAALITQAEDDDAATLAGDDASEVTIGSVFAAPKVKAAFQEEIASAKSVRDDASAIASERVAACQRLAQARDAFDAGKLIGTRSCFDRFNDVKAEIAQFGVENVWYVADGWLDSVVGAGLMAGYADGSGNFGPYDPITRGQVAVIIHRAATGVAPGEADDDVDAGFSDVERGAYYAAAVKWCADRGIVTGYDGTGEFLPNAPVSRQELATMLARYAGWRATGEAKAPAADPSCYEGLLGAGDVEPYAREAMAWCVQMGVVGGIDGVDLAPREGAWRASMAKMITVVLRVLQ